MRKMDGRDSAECQNWEKKDIKVIMEINLNEENDKIMNSCPLPLSKGKRKCGGEGRRGEMLEVLDLFFRVRVSSFSLSFCAIRPSAVFDARKKAALHGEGFVWVPDLGSFLKLREVGVSPYLGFTLYLSVFPCFG